MQQKRIKMLKPFSQAVIPAHAGIFFGNKTIDSLIHGNDKNDKYYQRIDKI